MRGAWGVKEEGREAGQGGGGNLGEAAAEGGGGEGGPPGDQGLQGRKKGHGLHVWGWWGGGQSQSSSKALAAEVKGPGGEAVTVKHEHLLVLLHPAIVLLGFRYWDQMNTGVGSRGNSVGGSVGVLEVGTGNQVSSLRRDLVCLVANASNIISE